MATDADPADTPLTEETITETQSEAAEHDADEVKDYDAAVGDEAGTESEDPAVLHVRTAM